MSQNVDYLFVCTSHGGVFVAVLSLVGKKVLVFFVINPVGCLGRMASTFLIVGGLFSKGASFFRKVASIFSKVASIFSKVASIFSKGGAPFWRAAFSCC